MSKILLFTTTEYNSSVIAPYSKKYFSEHSNIPVKHICKKYLTLVYTNENNDKIIEKQFDLTNIDVYKMLVNQYQFLKNIDVISFFGHVELINLYFEENAQTFEYSELAINGASEKGNIDVLNWFYNKRDILKFKYDENAIDNAMKNGHTNIIDWFYERRDVLNIKTNISSLDAVMYCCHNKKQYKNTYDEIFNLTIEA